MINDKTIKQVLKRVAEEFAFMFTEEVEDTVYEIPSNLVESEMEFFGPIRGKVIMIAPEEFCKIVISNVLGIEDIDGEEISVSVEEALCEFLNIFCGNLLTESFGEDVIFDLYPPKSGKTDLEYWGEMLSNEKFICVLIEEYPVYVCIKIK
ncbi:MAG: chemotaxis protein CheX [Candidatus Hydrogenedentes bacterium]|nr:chemotaxis protein CheX [Candidatus Hydrogenedentota bacterium]